MGLIVLSTNGLTTRPFLCLGDMHFERANSAEKALQIFDNELIRLNLSYKISFVGSFPKTTRCWLYCSNSDIAAVGNGKGVDLQSEVSAKYEALEHFVTTRNSFLQNQCLAFAFDEIENDLSPINKEILPLFFKINHKNKKTPWIFLKDYLHNSFIRLPYFLINPEYRKKVFPYDEVDYEGFSDIPTNNGTAIGTTFDEAIVHAINELIERDALSCFLLKTFGRKTPQFIRLINKDSLPQIISKTISKIERDYDEDLLIVDISTDLEFPTFLVSFTQQKQLFQPMGFGTSLSSLYALERATLEALQSFHLYDEASKLEDEQIMMRFNQWPKLAQCAQCNIKSLVNAGMFKQTNFSHFKYHPVEINDTLYETIKALKRKRISIFYAIHYQSENGVTCVKVVIPGMEQFHRIRYGSFAVPGKRGRDILLS